LPISNIIPFAGGTQLKSTSATTDPANPAIADGPKTFGSREDFLTLLIEQIKAQDPMDPMDSNQFTQQLVAYNQLQEAITLNQTIDDLKSNQDLAQGAQMIGKYIEGLDANNNVVTGVVESVEKVDGEVTLLIGDKLLLLSQVYTVSDKAPAVE
jgi:flagellar basal-body rod modification protein FlgD